MLQQPRQGPGLALAGNKTVMRKNNVTKALLENTMQSNLY
jgi:hypothetical protein